MTPRWEKPIMSWFSKSRRGAAPRGVLVLFAEAALIALSAWGAFAAAPGGPLRWVDFSGQTHRQAVIAAGTEHVYQGHPTTALMPDGKTIHCVWSVDHGGPCGPMATSVDGGRTWRRVPTPDDWTSMINCPSIYLLDDPRRVRRLIVFAARPDMAQTYSEDGGRTWSKVRSLGMPCVMAFSSVTRLADGRWLGMYHRGKDDRDAPPLSIWQSISDDGGLHWSPPRRAGAMAGRSPCEPEVVRSPDGRQLLCLMRENQRVGHSLWMTSDDEGGRWSAMAQTPWELSGDRHKARFAPDGRLVVCFRDMAPRSRWRGSFVAWVGRYEDVAAGRPGQYRVKLLHQHTDHGAGPTDCGYPGLELLGDGTLVATTYVKYRPGPEKQSVVCVRFRLAEIDATR